MKNIRHVSFDVWKTLIEPNPEFGKARLRFLAAELSLPSDTVEQVYRAIKDGADRAAEVAGVGATSVTLWQRLVGELGREHADWYELRKGMERLFHKHPPIVRRETIEALRLLQARGLGLSIASNTNFIRGECLHDVALGAWGVAWDFQVFSDELGYAKPHPRFWKRVKEQSFMKTAAKPHEVLHVGDNRICDGGCTSAQLQFAHIKGPADVPAVLEGIT